MFGLKWKSITFPPFIKKKNVHVCVEWFNTYVFVHYCFCYVVNTVYVLIRFFEWILLR